MKHFASLLRSGMIVVLLASFFLTPQSAQASSPGNDGAVTITVANTIVNRYTSLAANAAAGSTSLSVASAAALNVAPGDLILIIQMQGASIDTSVNTAAWGAVTAYNNAGNYEFATVYSVSGNTINLSPCGPFLQRSYTASGKVQVIRVPQYSTLTINAGASIGAPAWNGSTGGVAAVVAQTTVTINGSINVVGMGFRGGVRENNTTAFPATMPDYAFTDAGGGQNSGAQKGESIAGFTADYDALGGAFPGGYGRGAPANGGGGGNAHNAGGGGGANGYNGIAWNGQGNPNNSVAGWVTAWGFDPTLTSATTSSGGGRGGYTYSAANLNATTAAGAPGLVGWGGDNRQERGGLGGRPLIGLPVGADTSNHIFFGGGGGAGDGNDNANANGGAGGGIVFVLAPTVTGTGTINASGQTGSNTVPGHNDAPGGGGGGGSVIVGATTLSSVSISANGGKGGNQLIALAESEGPGGGGSGGVVATSGGFVPIVVNGGANGQTGSTALTEFLPNGATSGAAGNTSIIVPTIPNQTCIGVAKTVTNVTVVAGPAYDVQMAVRVVNMGSDRLTNVQVTDNLSTVFSAIPGTTFNVTVAPVVTFSPGGGTIAGNAGFNGNANTNLLTTGTLNIGSTALITFTVRVTPPAGGPYTYNNAANGTGTGAVTGNVVNDTSQNGINSDPDGDGNSGNNNIPTPITLPAVIPTVTKAFVPSPVNPGVASTLTITLTNPSVAALTSATVTDNLPSGLTTVAATAATTCGGTASQTSTSVSLSGGTIPAAGNCTLSVQVTGAGGGAYLNTIPAGALSTSGGVNTVAATSTLNVNNSPLTVAKSFNPASIPVGGVSQLTIVITNPNTTAVALTNPNALTDTYPAGVTNAAVPAGATTCGGTVTAVAGTGTVVLTGAGNSVPANGSCTITVNVTSTTPGPAVTNTIAANAVQTVTAGLSNVNPATASLTVSSLPPDVVKSFAPTTIGVGATSTLTFTITNPNTTALNNISFVDVLPAGLTAVNGNATVCGGPANNRVITLTTTITVTGGVLAGGANCTFNVTVTGTTSGVKNNTTGAVSSTQTGIGPTSNTATLLVAAADLSITKTDGVAAVNAGGTTTYTIVVANAGPSAANNAVFTDPAVAGLTATGVTCGTATGGAACPAVPATTVALMQGAGIVIPTLPSGGSVTFTVNANVTAVGGTVANTASVATPAGTSDPLPGNNSATDTDTVTPIANLVVTKTDSAANVNAGGTTTYTLTLTNNGPSAANNSTIRDAAAAGLTKTGIGACTAAGGAVCPTVGAGAGQMNITNLEAGTVVVPTLPNGGSISFTVTVDVTATSGTVDNIFTATPPAGTTDPSPATVTDTDTVTPIANLVVTKTDSAANVNAGGTTTYTLTLTNNGPSAANNSTIRDAAAAGLTKTGIGACTAAGGAVCPTVGAGAGQMNITNLEAGTVVVPTLPNGGSISFTVTVDVTATSGTVDNIFTATPPAGTTDPSPATVTDTDTVTPIANLVVTKTDSAANVNAGGTTTYTLTLTNNGPSAANNSTIRDAVAAGLSKTGIGACTPAGGAVCPTVGAGAGQMNITNLEAGTVVVPTLPNGGSISFTVTANVTATTGTVANTFTSTPPVGTTDPTPATTTDTDTVIEIDAVNDTGASVNGYTGGQSFADVLINDTLNGNPATLLNINLTQVSTTNAGVTLNPLDGSVNVAAGTPAGTYTVTYQICDKANPSICDTATVSVNVTAAPIDAVDDDFTGTPVNGLTGGTTATVYSNDTLNGAAFANGDVTPSITADGGLTGVGINADGTLSVPAGTAAGTYTVTYQICEVLNATNCDPADVTIQVDPAVIVANDDDYSGTPVNGLTGGTTATVYSNDTLNGAAFANGDVTPSITADGGLTGVGINADGTLSVPQARQPGHTQ
ncbi:MAG: DUF11 domain-containing protein [Anaerolineales bacterium]|nr:DUF11 domain-containing protein [Anaerolineales bacterium]